METLDKLDAVTLCQGHLKRMDTPLGDEFHAFVVQRWVASVALRSGEVLVDAQSKILLPKSQSKCNAAEPIAYNSQVPIAVETEYSPLSHEADWC